MSDRIYTCSFTGIAVTTAVDAWILTPADDKPIEIIGLFWGQSSDAGDAQDEMLGYRVIRGFTSAGTGTSTTPRPLNRSDAASGFTCVTNASASTTGTTNDLHADAFNVRAGEKLWLPEGCEWQATQGDTTLVVRLIGAPADSLTMSGTLYVREQG